ncbi:hypothetical protein PPTG_25046, partial [Phytophthora nicotianae INRA-310]
DRTRNSSARLASPENSAVIAPATSVLYFATYALLMLRTCSAGLSTRMLMNVVSSVPMRPSPALYNASASAAAFALVWMDALKSTTSPRIAVRITFFKSPLNSPLKTFTRSSPYFSWNVFFRSAISAFERAITTG